MTHFFRTVGREIKESFSTGSKLNRAQAGLGDTSLLLAVAGITLIPVSGGASLALLGVSAVVGGATSGIEFGQGAYEYTHGQKAMGESEMVGGAEGLFMAGLDLGASRAAIQGATRLAQVLGAAAMTGGLTMTGVGLAQSIRSGNDLGILEAGIGLGLGVAGVGIAARGHYQGDDGDDGDDGEESFTRSRANAVIKNHITIERQVSVTFYDDDYYKLRPQTYNNVPEDELSEIPEYYIKPRRFKEIRPPRQGNYRFNQNLSDTIDPSKNLGDDVLVDPYTGNLMDRSMSQRQMYNNAYSSNLRVAWSRWGISPNFAFVSQWDSDYWNDLAALRNNGR